MQLNSFRGYTNFKLVRSCCVLFQLSCGSHLYGCIQSNLFGYAINKVLSSSSSLSFVVRRHCRFNTAQLQFIAITIIIVPSFVFYLFNMKHFGRRVIKAFLARNCTTLLLIWEAISFYLTLEIFFLNFCCLGKI